MSIRDIGCSLLAIGILLSASFTVLAGDIHHSVTKGDLPTTVSLIEKDIGLLNVRDDSGRTPLILAADSGFIEIADSLIWLGADINLTDKDNRSPLHHAAANGSLSITRLLLEHETTTISIVYKSRGFWVSLALRKHHSYILFSECGFGRMSKH